MPPVKNLDAFNSPPFKILLGGQEYLVPGDYPIVDMLRADELQEKITAGDADQAAAAAKELYERILRLVQVNQPDVTELPLHPTTLLGFFQIAYGDAEPEPDPTPPKKAASTRSTAAKKSRSRSPRS